MKITFKFLLAILLINTSLFAGFQVTTGSPARKVSDIGQNQNQGGFQIVAHDSLSDDIQQNVTGTNPASFIAYAITSDGHIPLPTDTNPPSLPNGISQVDFDRNRNQGRIVLRFAEWDDAKVDDFSEVSLYPYNDAESDCEPCIGELNQYKCGDRFRDSWTPTRVKIDMAASRSSTNKEVAIAINALHRDEKSSTFRYLIYTIKAKISNGKWRLDPTTAEIFIRHQPNSSGTVVDANPIPDVAITPHQNGVDYQIYWPTYTIDLISSPNNSKFYLNRAFLGSSLGSSNCFTGGYFGGFLYSTVDRLPNGTAAGIHIDTNYVDVVFDPATNKDYISIPGATSNGTSFNSTISLYSAQKNSTIQNDISSVIDSFEGNYQSIDVYPWSTVSDFSIAYAKSDGVFFKRYKSNNTVESSTLASGNQGFDYMPSLTTYNDALSDTNDKITEVVSWNGAGGDVNGTYKISTALFKNYSVTPYIKEVPIASQGDGYAYPTSLNTAHPDRTPSNSFSVVSASAPVSSTTSSGGLLATWLSASISHPGSSWRYLNIKKTTSDPTKTKVNFKTSRSWINTQSYGTPSQFSQCGFPASSTNWIDNLNDLYLTDGFCLNGAVRSKRFGRLEFNFPIVTWNPEDQAFKTTINITPASYQLPTQYATLQAKYMEDESTLDIDNGIPDFYHDAGTAQSIQSTSTIKFPVVSDPTNAGNYYWNYWTEFPAQYNYLGLSLKDSRSPSSQSTLSSEAYIRGYYDTQYGAAASVDVEYFDWLP